MTFGGDTTAGSKGRPGQTDDDVSHRIMDRFVECGGNFIDTADVYPADNTGSVGHTEEIIGRWLSKPNRCVCEKSFYNVAIV